MELSIDTAFAPRPLCHFLLGASYDHLFTFPLIMSLQCKSWIGTSQALLHGPPSHTMIVVMVWQCNLKSDCHHLLISKQLQTEPVPKTRPRPKPNRHEPRPSCEVALRCRPQQSAQHDNPGPCSCIHTSHTKISRVRSVRSGLMPGGWSTTLGIPKEMDHLPDCEIT